jgi:hypothetical protein
MLMRSCLYAASVAAVMSSPWAATAQEAKVGALRCDVDPGMGMIVASQKEMHCVFVSQNGHVEHYRGSIEKFGVDVGATDRGQLIWDVYAPTERPHKGALAGDYAGVGASVTLGPGIGANAMVGGNDRSFALQPVSVQTQTGVNVAGGVTAITLRAFR